MDINSYPKSDMISAKFTDRSRAISDLKVKNLSEEQKLKWAKLSGSLYFLLLGVINFGATLYYSNIFAIDYTILLLGCLPILINRRSFFLVFGIFGSLISLYMAFAALIFNFNPEIKTSQLAFNMGYLLATSILFSSVLLVYVGLRVVGTKISVELPKF